MQSSLRAGRSCRALYLEMDQLASEFVQHSPVSGEQDKSEIGLTIGSELRELPNFLAGAGFARCRVLLRRSNSDDNPHGATTTTAFVQQKQTSPRPFLKSCWALRNIRHTADLSPKTHPQRGISTLGCFINTDSTCTDMFHFKCSWQSVVRIQDRLASGNNLSR